VTRAAGLSPTRHHAGDVARPESGHSGLLASFARDRQGNILIFTALGVAVLIGAAGLGTEVASWYSQKRAMQNAADLAAEGAIISLRKNLASASATTRGYARVEARTASSLHQYPNVSPTTVTVNIRPEDAFTTGGYTAAAYDNKAVEVIVTKPASLMFASLFLPSAPTIRTRAVAIIDVSNGDCLLALNPSVAKAFQIAGNGTINIDCGIAVNSNASGGAAKDNAFYLQGSVSVTATNFTINGGIGVTGGASYASPNPISTGTQTTDPYGSGGQSPYTFPSSSGALNQGSFSDSPGSTNTLQPGIYSSVSITGTASLVPGGTYFINGGTFSLGGNLTGTGVTIVLTNGATFQMGNNATANLSAPTSGSNAGMVIVQDPASSAVATLQSNGNCQTNCNVFQGGPSTRIVGAVYFPNGNVTYQGTPSNRSTDCMQLIANSLQWQGNPTLLVNGCNGTGVTQFGPMTARLAE
jgi:Flp pilus assembly protein TadG